MAGRPSKAPIQSTAGAIPIMNDKGEVSMQKVKVSRYVAGKRPEYAPQDFSDEEDEIEISMAKKAQQRMEADTEEITEAEKEDPRLRRLMEMKRDEEEEDDDDDAVEERVARRRRVHEPEVIAEDSDDEEEEEEEERQEEERRRRVEPMEESEEEDEEELDEEEIERRRALLRQKARQRQEEDEVMEVEDENKEGESEEESSEYEEFTDSEDEETGPRLKPVFVRKKDRVTIQEKEKEDIKSRELEAQAKKLADERKKEARKLVEELTKQEMEEQRDIAEACDAVNSEEENDEEEYEAWKVRELKRIKRDRDEREALEKEKVEIDRIRNMTEEERKAELKANPKVITNKASKGKYKFLQKYYHRGAFFLHDKEDAVYKRDYSAPTLEDHFDKTVLPKVMQVKNFGRSGRTKYTHLVDQDTTEFNSPWISDTAANLKFHTTKGGGMKEVFDRPSAKKRR
ncbi:microfibrillar-associated protein 1 [Lingula anatina]|uniref:Microfibrillar-associated protein 1 n=1 Tax=Lingula anatina TaxID=7574 RepID=A0A1S3K3F1_LINAN|nr:microfibrillar-associated protein 1 [Lingula anatina]|eukprot:XP_013417150.1 microfibrillar-associated protein 1 [Lingula anatina]